MSVQRCGQPIELPSTALIKKSFGAAGHTLPLLLRNVIVALAIAWVRHRYSDTPRLQATFQGIVGGLTVLAAGILIGKS